MIQDEDHADTDLKALLASPRAHPIHMASESLAAIKLGLKLSLYEIPADEYALMLCIERESNRHQIAKASTQHQK